MALHAFPQAPTTCSSAPSCASLTADAIICPGSFAESYLPCTRATSAIACSVAGDKCEWGGGVCSHADYLAMDTEMVRGRRTGGS
jgi:hypothetical protein